MDQTAHTPKERQFFEALGQLFIGAPVEGESGLAHLMHLKARYYQRRVLPHLKAAIDRALAPFPEFREELFDRLYSFFRRYFTEAGAIAHEPVYELIYTSDRDVMLFWKTHRLYYVKTERQVRSMTVEIDGWRFLLDVSGWRPAANEKQAFLYRFQKQRSDGTLVLQVTASGRGRRTQIAEIQRDIRQHTGLEVDEATLSQVLRLFERQQDVDYFIHKDARQFLREQFHQWLYRYLFEPEQQRGTLWSERRLRQLQVLKDIAEQVIDFIAQFEEELARLWNKPRFVLDSHYLMTLDRIAAQEGGLALLEQLVTHPGMAAQCQEWRDLGMVAAGFTPAQLWVENLWGRFLHERYQYLPLDTRYFPDMELAILSLFDPLDQQLDGWLVHSENYQALNTLLPKFRGRVKCIYIDPPYNTGGDEFIYRDRFRRSSWLTMMENRLRLAREWLRDDGVIFVSVDDGEQATLRQLLETIFGPENFVNNLIWQKKYAPQNDARWLSDNHDFLVLFAKNKEKWRPGLLPRTLDQNRRYQNPDRDPRGPWQSDNLAVKTYSPAGDYPITTPTGRVVYPPQGYCWRVSRERFQELLADNRIWFGRDGHGVPRLKRFLHEIKQGVTPLTLWTYAEVGHTQEAKQELKRMLSGTEAVFGTPKPVRLLQRVVTIGCGDDPEALVLDFFAGSGTTAQAVLDLNRRDGGRRKYLLVEMGETFDTVLLPRLKRAIFSDLWKNGQAQATGRGISHFAKYFRLEQYEDILRRARYQDDLETVAPEQSIFQCDLKLLDNAETGEPVVEWADGEMRVILNRLYADMDIAETLSCLTGQWIRRITATQPSHVEWEEGTLVDVNNPPCHWVKPLLYW